jgi:uncharacterized protein (TIGR03435 family)
MEHRMQPALRLIAAWFLAAAMAHAQPTPAPAFDAASIKPTAEQPDSGSGITTIRGRIIARNVTLKRCIRGAYDVPETNIFGAPKWAGEQRYDIDAKAPAPGDGDLMAMLRTLLADRFKLAFHWEDRQLPGYTLVAGKGGIKARPSSPDVGSDATSRNGGVEATGCTMAMLALKLSEALHMPVADGTGIAGRYDFTLSWPPADMDAGVVTAIQEQLGLKLESRKVTTKVFVIDSAQPASGN